MIFIYFKLPVFFFCQTKQKTQEYCHIFIEAIIIIIENDHRVYDDDDDDDDDNDHTIAMINEDFMFFLGYESKNFLNSNSNNNKKNIAILK